MTSKKLTAEQQKREEGLRARCYELALNSERSYAIAGSGRPLTKPSYIAEAKKIYDFIKKGE